MSYILTKAGILKCINVVIGLLAVSLLGAGHGKHDLTKAPSPVPCNSNGDCAHIWAGELGMSIVILAWFFSIALLFISLFTKLTWNLAFGKLDVFGHLVFGILLLAADALIITYIVTSSRATCNNNKQILAAGVSVKCTAHVIFISMYFILWLLGLIFASGVTLLFFITSYVVKRQATVGPTRTVPMNGAKY